jgi:hypothetical protein
MLGDVGVLEKDDHSSKPYKVKAETGAKVGSTWWYSEDAIKPIVQTSALGWGFALKVEPSVDKLELSEQIIERYE